LRACGPGHDGAALRQQEAGSTKLKRCGQNRPKFRGGYLPASEQCAIIGRMWPAHETTEQLVVQAQGGDRDAAESLLERHRRALRRLVGMRLDHQIRRRVDVSDVVQEVMLEASRRLDDYLREASMPFHLWLRQIAQDRIIDAHRRHRVSAKRSVDREQHFPVPHGQNQSSLQLASVLGDPRLTPAAASLRRELARRIEVAISQLGPDDGEVIVMRHYEQLTNQEIAQVLGLTEPAASMRYLRALRRLRALIDDESTAGGGRQ